MIIKSVFSQLFLHKEFLYSNSCLLDENTACTPNHRLSHQHFSHLSGRYNYIIKYHKITIHFLYHCWTWCWRKGEIQSQTYVIKHINIFFDFLQPSFCLYLTYFINYTYSHHYIHFIHISLVLVMWMWFSISRAHEYSVLGSLHADLCCWRFCSLFYQGQFRKLVVFV